MRAAQGGNQTFDGVLGNDADQHRVQLRPRFPTVSPRPSMVFKQVGAHRVEVVAHPLGFENVGNLFCEDTAFGLGDQFRAESDGDPAGARDAQHEGRREGLGAPAPTVGILKPAQPGVQDAPDARLFALFIQANPDERTVEIGGGRETARLQGVERPGLGKAQAVQAVRRSLVAGEHTGLGEDEPERDGTQLLAQKAGLKTDGDELLQRLMARWLVAPRFGRFGTRRRHALPPFQNERGDGIGISQFEHRRRGSRQHGQVEATLAQTERWINAQTVPALELFSVSSGNSPLTCRLKMLCRAGAGST